MATTPPDEPEPDAGVAAARQPLAERLTRGAGVAGIGFVLTRAITFATYIVLAQLIEPRDAGRLAAAQVLLGLGFVFAESGMLAALIHWRGDIDEAASTATVSSVATGVLLSLLGLATAPLIGAYFDSSTIGWVAAASSGLMLVRSLQIVPDALLQRRFAFVRRVTVDPLGALMHAAVAITCCAAGLGVWGLLAGQYALYLTQAIAGWGLLGWRPKRRLVSFATWRTLAGYARHLVAGEVVRRSTAQLDSILLGRFAGAGPLGQYAYGLRIAATPTDAWVSVANYALLPAFARIADDAERFRRAFVEALGALVAVGLPVSLMLAVTGDQLALALIGPDWPRAGDAIVCLSAVGIGQMLNSISSETYKAAGRPQLLPRLHLFTTALSIVLLPAALIIFDDDVIGIAIAISVVQLLSGFFAIHLAGPLVGVSPIAAARATGGVVLATAIAVAGAFAFEWLALHPTTSRVGAGGQALADVAVLVAIYLPALRLLAPADFGRLATMGRRLRPGR